jgi:hypothetical protein
MDSEKMGKYIAKLRKQKKYDTKRTCGQNKCYG